MIIKIRSRNLFVFNLIFFIFLSFTCFFSKVIFAADPYIYWPLESNTSINDIMGVMDSGTTTGTISVGVGHSGQALIFSSGSRATIGDGSKLLNFSGNDKRFSVSAWIKKDNFSGGGFGRVVGKMNQDNSENIWAMGITQEGGLYCAIFSNNSQQTSLITTDLNPKVYLNNGEWNYIGCVFNIQGRKIDGFVNGIKVGSKTISDANSTLAESDQSIVINSKSTGNDAFNGTIDEIKIFNSLTWLGDPDTTPPALSFTNPLPENYSIYTNPKPFVSRVSSKQTTYDIGISCSDPSGVYSVEYRNNEGIWTTLPNILSTGHAAVPISSGINKLEFRATDDYYVSRNTTSAENYLTHTVTAAEPIDNLMAHWNFESNTKLTDSVGYIADTVFSGGTPTVVEGHTGNALSFTNGSYASVRDYPYIKDFKDIYGSSFFSSQFKSFSVEAWVKSTNFAEVGSYQNIVSSITYPDEMNWEMGVDNIGGLFCFYNDKGMNDPSISTSAAPVPVYLNSGEWNHVACVWDRRTGILKAYINNQLVSQTEYYLGYHDLDSSTEGTLNIAAHNDGSSHFNGQVDEVKIYNSAYNFTTDPAAELALTIGTQTKTYCSSPNAVIPKSSDETGAVDTINIPDDFTYDSLSYSLNISHTNAWDLTARISHDVSVGTTAYLFDTDRTFMYFRSGNGVGVTIDELSNNNLYYGTSAPSIPQNTGTFFPHEYYTLLSSEHSSKGPWTIDVFDPYNEDPGTLDSWCITFRYTPNSSPDSNNNTSNNTSSTSSPSAPECHATKPGIPVIIGHKTINKNSLILDFKGLSENITRYDLLFGTSKNNLSYGAIDIARKNDHNFLVSYLKPKTKYYFRLIAVNDCLPGDYSPIYEASIGTPSHVSYSNNILPVPVKTLISGKNQISTPTPSLNSLVTPSVALPKNTKVTSFVAEPNASNIFGKIITFFKNIFKK